MLPLFIAAIILLLPITAIADSSNQGRSNFEDIQLSLHVNSHEVTAEIEFENLAPYWTYLYTIEFTRVDPNFPHVNETYNFTAESDTHDFDYTWTPDQDGPYTVEIQLYDHAGNLLDTETDSIDWGDVANNSSPPVADISVSLPVELVGDNPELIIQFVNDTKTLYIDVFENESRLENVTIGFDVIETELGGDYTMSFKVYELHDDTEPQKLIGMSLGTFHASYSMATLNNSVGGWIDGGEYMITLGLTLDWNGNVTNAAYSEFNFTIGAAPYLVIELGGCMDLNATNYDENATFDDGSCVFPDEDEDGVFDHLEIAGCMDVNATNYDSNATDDDGTCVFLDTDDDGVFDHLEVDGCTDQNATNYDTNATDDDGTCVFLDTDGDGVFDHREIRGCTNSTALNFEVNATDDDSTCVWPTIPLSASIEASLTEGDAPLNVSLKANISGGQGPYQVSWDLGDGNGVQGENLNHTFAAGIYNVTLRVATAGSVVEDIIQIVSNAPLVSDLTGYFGHSGRLNPLSEESVAAFEFTAAAQGGEGAYTFSWQFGDNSEGSGTPVLHEYSAIGNYTILLIIEDSAGRILTLSENITIESDSEGEGEITSPEPTEIEGGDSNFSIYATSTGVIGLLLIFGLFGRKRREGFLEAERRKIRGEDSIWD